MTNIEAVLKTIKAERTALLKLEKELCSEVDAVIDVLHQCRGKVIFIAVGKSGHIAKKIAATFASTGTPSFFIHGTEAVHGDLGMIEKNDICILISNSGKTQEVIQCIPHIKKIGAITIAMTSQSTSPLAINCNYKLIYPAVEEADPIHCAPTSSSTITLVFGDALACALMEKNKFTSANFLKFHPGGSLGEKLGDPQ